MNSKEVGYGASVQGIITSHGMSKTNNSSALDVWSVNSRNENVPLSVENKESRKHVLAQRHAL
jgi:hypothetical protein